MELILLLTSFLRRWTNISVARRRIELEAFGEVNYVNNLLPK
jgi:hypothetical protein